MTITQIVVAIAAILSVLSLVYAIHVLLKTFRIGR